MPAAYMRVKYYPANSKMKVSQRGKARDMILFWTRFCIGNGDLSKEDLLKELGFNA